MLHNALAAHGVEASYVEFRSGKVLLGTVFSGSTRGHLANRFETHWSIDGISGFEEFFASGASLDFVIAAFKKAANAREAACFPIHDRIAN